LIVVVLVIGGWLGWLVRSTRIQAEAVTAVETTGGSVRYAWEWTNGKRIPGGKPSAPKWLVDLVGRDYFGYVTGVSHSSTKYSDSSLAHLEVLTKLEKLTLPGRPFTDAGLEHLEGLTNLSELDLGGTRVTDAGLVHLKGLKNLSELDLCLTDVTDAGLVHLRGLNKLSRLNLFYTRVTDAGLVHLKGLTNLSVLHLDNTNVTDAGVNALQQALPSLKINR
jgi:Leucine-rich repeat (LRR) protein